MRMLFACLLAALFAAPAGAQTDAAVTTTLQMDPEAPEQFRGWWLADNALLKIGRNGSFQLWKGRDRYARPHTVGRWHQRNHAVLMLESYALPRPRQARFSMWLDEKALKADLGSMTLTKISKAPHTPEDGLIGLWVGEGGTLVMHDNLTYSWAAPYGESAEPVVLGSQDGTWSYRNGELRLIPLAPRQTTAITALVIDEDGGVVGFSSIRGSMERPEPAPPTPKKAVPKTS